MPNNNSHIAYVISRWSLRLLLLLLPVFFLTVTADIIELNKFIFLGWVVGLGVISWLVGAVLDPTWRWKRTPLLLPVIIWVGAVGLSTIFSINRWLSLVGTVGYYHHSFLGTVILGFFFLWVTQIVDKQFLKHLSWWLLASVALVIIISALQFAGVYIFNNQALESNGFNTISVSGSLFTVFLAVAVILGIGLGRSATVSWQRLGAWLVAFGAFVIMALYDRTIGWYALIGGVLLLLAASYRDSETNVRWNLSLIGILATVVLLILIPINITTTSDVSLNTATSWSIAQKTLSDHLVFGSGPSTFMMDFAEHRPDNLNQSILWDVRFVKSGSDWWQIATTTGLVGFLAWLFLQLMVVRLVWRRWRSKDNIELLSFVAAWVVVLIGGILFPTSIMVWFMYWLLLAALSIIAYDDKRSGLRSGRSTYASMILSLAVIGGILLVLISGRLWLSEWYLARAQTAIANTEDITLVGSYLEKSVSLNGNEARNKIALAQNLIVQAQLGLADGTLDETAANRLITDAVASGESALASEPLNPESYDSLIVLYQAINSLTGQATGAVVLELQQQLSDLEPNHPRHISDLGLSYLSRSQALLTQSEDSEDTQTIIEQAETDLEQALTLFQQAAQLRPQYATATLGIIRVFQLQSFQDEALALADQAAQDFSDDPNALFTLATIYSSYEENDRAVAVLLRAEVLVPEDLTIIGTIAQLYNQINNTDKAIEYYKKVQQIAPEDETAAAALEILEGTETEVAE